MEKTSFDVARSDYYQFGLTAEEAAAQCGMTVDEFLEAVKRRDAAIIASINIADVIVIIGIR